MTGAAYQRDVVTGEAVALDLRVAQLPSRALALMIDMTIQIAMLFGAFFLLSVMPATLDEALVSAIVLVCVVAVIVGYPLVLETTTRGKTVGKLAFGLRVVRDDGGSIRFRHALVRALIEVFEIWIFVGVPALFCSLVNSRGKRFGDLAAGTVVIRERVQGRTGSQAAMPPELALWVSTVDVGRVPDDLALAARQYLVRAPELRPEVGWSMAVRLATDIHPYLVPPPPARVPPERLLAAVVAERRRREESRLAAQAAATQVWTDTGRSTTVPPAAPPAPPPAPVPPAAPVQPPAPTPPPPAPPADGGFTAPG